MKRQKRRNALRKRLEKLGIIAMILVSSGLMFQLIINVLIMNSNNLVTAYSRELNETNYIEIETKTHKKVPIARSYAKSFKEAYFEYMFKEGD